MLAETCNVTRACERPRVSVGTSPIAGRKSDAAFRAGMDRGDRRSAYQRLELVLLDRAFNGTEKVVTRKRRVAKSGCSNIRTSSA